MHHILLNRSLPRTNPLLLVHDAKGILFVVLEWGDYYSKGCFTSHYYLLGRMVLLLSTWPYGAIVHTKVS